MQQEHKGLSGRLTTSRTETVVEIRPDRKTHICHLLHKCAYAGRLEVDEQFGECFMSRISIDVTSEEHQKLKALAALQGKSIKDYVIERTLGVDGDASQEAALNELESLLDERIRSAH